MTGRHECRHELLDDGRDRRGRLIFRERVRRDPKILREESSSKSRNVVRVENPLAVRVEHTAAGEAAEQNRPNACRIDARFTRERERFADRGECAADHHLVADLAELTRSRRTDVHDAFFVAHRLEHRARAFDRRRVAPNHDRERGALGANLAAADRRVDHRRPEFSRASRQTASHRRRDGAAVDDQAARRKRSEHSVGTLEHGFHIRRVGHHRHDNGRLSRDIGRRLCGLRSGRDQLVDWAAAAAVHDDTEAAREKIPRHGPPHDSKSDEPDPFSHETS